MQLLSVFPVQMQVFLFIVNYTEVNDRCRMRRFLPHHPRISVISFQPTPLYSHPVV